MQQDEAISTMVKRLREFHAQDAEERIGGAIRRGIGDPLKPESDSGQLCFHPILLLLAGLVAFALGAFLFFSLGGS